MKYERQRHGTLLPCTPQIFSIKHASCTLFCSVGDYHDASLLVEFTIWGSCMWLLLHRIHFPLVSVGLCPWRCAHALLQSVCGVGGATRVRNRGERYAWTNPPCAPRCCCWLSPTLCWVDGIHISLWWSPCIWFLSNTAPSHCVGESLVVASIHDCVCCLFFLIPLFCLVAIV
ncbi:putative retrotransposon hot spot protein (RHS) [Trypanosoma cruzi]|uniref:Putative retrotransposon hot spot protein (RHS) n=1 Tax=Trypanosoma cruzi TaxID=5693 RepID=A0A2V2XLT4_TRYCR|nr:putative retrotransposon hot spot protein (RHS) [Trypanosoma cruzi]